MSIDELKAMRVPADPQGCVLYLRATVAKLTEAMDLIAAWGFIYKSHAIWDKVKPGMGYWFRGQHELLMAATLGRISPPPQALRIPSVLRCKRAEHSSKPDDVRRLIETWYPQAARLEMFARESHAGWDTFGNQISGTLFDPTPRSVKIA
jgi:N6-adenosine-specific RNA methylase IME4